MIYDIQYTYPGIKDQSYENKNRPWANFMTNRYPITKISYYNNKSENMYFIFLLKPHCLLITSNVTNKIPKRSGAQHR